MSASLVVLLVVLTSVIHEDDTCKELKPTTHFKNGMVKFSSIYLVVKKKLNLGVENELKNIWLKNKTPQNRCV